MYCCYSCLTGFTDQQKLREHNKYCYENTAMITPAPGKDILSFRKPQREVKIPFIIYGDFESFIVPVKNRFPGRKTNRVQKHVPASYCLNTVCVNDEYSKLSPVYRVGDGESLSPEVHMLLYLFAEQARIQQILSDRAEKFTTLKSYRSAVKCYVRGKPFAEDFHDKVPFVDPIANKYIGAVHESCRQFQKFIPVVFHNLQGYDGHFILRALGHPEIVKYCSCNNIRINCIPSTSEKLLSLTIGKLRFINSIQFMNSSLDNLARNCSNLRITRKYFPDEFVADPLISKGIFQYEYFTDPGVFDEPSLPPREAFYSSLYDSDITTKQYEQALRAWDLFQCNNFGDYHDTYLQLDVLLLSDVFEEFKTTSLTQYGLDPAHYFSAPGLSWDAALKHSQVELELLTDPDMYLFIERGTRGGISVVTKKYSRGNNKYLHDYDPTEPSKYICYLDTNNLYGPAMSMPYGGFQWISPEEFLAETSNATATMNPDVSYFVEVDVDYPAQLHDDYPYLPEHLVITDDMLSREQLALRTTTNCGYVKLVPDLFNKRGYICHYKLLKQALDAGLVLKKVHRVLRFNHSCWLNSYIDANTTRRTAAKSDFEKDFFKLMNNSVFGKTIENVRNRVNIDIVNNVNRRNKLTRRNCFENSRRISDNLVLITRKQRILKLNKPIYVGAAVLDLSKTIMYDFHYGFFLKQFPTAELLLSDTDSLVYEVPCEDLYQEIYDHRELFDLSDVSVPQFHDSVNKKVIGKFKDEFAFRPVREFCGLRSKMYSLVTEDDVVVKKAKGVNNNYVRNKLTFNNYLAALTRTPGCKLPTVTTRGFRSYRHEVVTDEITKTGLNNFDDKRFTRFGINTTALGHCRNFT